MPLLVEPTRVIRSCLCPGSVCSALEGGQDPLCLSDWNALELQYKLFLSVLFAKCLLGVGHLLCSLSALFLWNVHWGIWELPVDGLLGSHQQRQFT